MDEVAVVLVAFKHSIDGADCMVLAYDCACVAGVGLRQG